MRYISSRGNYPEIGISEAITTGMVPRGGLFLPENIPEMNFSFLLHTNDYREIGYRVLEPYFCHGEKHFTEEELRSSLEVAYRSTNFDTPEIAPVTVLSNNIGILELWHGPTAAFKDMALQILPHWLVIAKKKLNQKTVTIILVATSGDTGKAALEGFKNIPGTEIYVFFPDEGVSLVQKLQMLTTEGVNTRVIAVEGNFDDCQTMVKEIFANQDFKSKLATRQYKLSSANSINWGRLAPQIVYYVWGYVQLIRKLGLGIGHEIDVVVPTGNFGNILAAYYAKRMGLPIRRLICASNQNNVLTDFLRTGVYDRQRPFYKTYSPSMDILISSNLERFLAEVTKHNFLKIQNWYMELQQQGRFKVDSTTLAAIREVMSGYWTSEVQTLETIREVYHKENYLLDPHTAVAYHGLKQYWEDEEKKVPTLICSTASPFKFNGAIYQALFESEPPADEFAAIERIVEYTHLEPHRAVKTLQGKVVLHRDHIQPSEGLSYLEKKLFSKKHIRLKKPSHS
ncbi:threonine synthase [Thermospira aquatica]|uniref:Threonine synthase n=1 Tax=Thermospira aquatica TaxID=2828656 RepID=A0AAX3BBS2_9SPIR|nr:threonine synthase [Thermospira aquatica]URA09566.1 threonine synthase [Thermospira aquatica]